MNHPHSQSSFDRDLLRFAEGSLSEEELALFEVRLASEPALRDDLRNLAEQAFAIGEHVRNSEAISEIRSRSGIITLPQKKQVSWKTHLPWAAAALITISALFVFSKNKPSVDQPVTILEVLEASGTASWITEDGARIIMLETGMRLPPGALEISSESGMARLRFDDDTTLSFTGVSDAIITQTMGKSLRMKRGQLSAKVSPQRSNNPMRIETPTSEVVILGTQFSLNVKEQTTGLDVFEGKVRMRRLSDGKEQNVPSGRQLTSTLEGKAEFVPIALPKVLDAWTSDLTYTVQHSTDLIEWLTNGIDQSSGTPIGQSATATMTVSPSLNRCFLRLRVTNP